MPIEFSFTPGSVSDIKGLENLSLHLPEDSILLGDRAYTDDDFEDKLQEIEGIKLLAKRKRNSKRQHQAKDEFFLSTYRNLIETVFSSIISKMPRNIKARTEKGFCLKVVFFILVYMVQLYFPLSESRLKLF